MFKLRPRWRLTGPILTTIAKMTRQAILAGLFISVTALGCDAQTADTTRANSTSATSIDAFLHPADFREIPTAMDKWLLVSERYPQFAGAYLAADNSEHHLVLTENRDAHEIANLVADLFERPTDHPTRSNVIVHIVKYSYRQLYDFLMLEPVRAISRTEFALSTEIDTRNNRIHFEFLRGISQDEIDELLLTTGIPEDAVSYNYDGVLDIHADLTDRHRPVMGGARIHFADTAQMWPCSMTPILQQTIISGHTGYGFLTNSHCTTAFFQADDLFGDVFQNTVASANYVGEEFLDMAPTPAVSEPACTDLVTGCRYADASYIEFSASAPGSPAPYDASARYKLFLTTGIGSTTIHSTTPTRTITSERDAQDGETVALTGATSGYRTGTVLNADVPRITGAAGVMFVHQVSTNYIASDGDSGAPVTNPYNAAGRSPLNADFYGIHWGSLCSLNPTTGTQECVSYFSPINGVEKEMGLLVTFAGDSK